MKDRLEEYARSGLIRRCETWKIYRIWGRSKKRIG